MREQIAHVEKIARVLPIKGSDNLSAVEVREGQNLYFREAVLIFHSLGDAAPCGFVGATAHHRRDLDLGLYVRPHVEVCHRSACAAFCQVAARNGFLDAFLDAFHRCIDGRERLRVLSHRQVSKIDIDRKTRHVAEKEVDGRSTFQGEAVFLGDQRERAVGSTICLRYSSANAIEVPRHGDVTSGVELAALDQHAFAGAEMKCLGVELVWPKRADNDRQRRRRGA